LGSDKGQQEVILEMLSILEEVENSMGRETQYRVQVENVIESELTDMNKRLLIEVKAREELKKTLEEAVKIEGSLLTEIELLRTKLRFLVDRHTFSIEDDTEDLDLMGLTDEIEARLKDMTSLLDMDTGDVDQSPAIKALLDKVNHETNSRIELEARSGNLEYTVEDLLTKLEAERTAAQELRRRIEEQ
jgi:hypothetical protein